MRDHRTEVTIVKCDGWEAVYFDGKLINQGHRLDVVDDVLKPLCALRVGHTTKRRVNQDWAEVEGNFPVLLSDIPPTAYEE